jgi:hypothetical protein
MQLQEAVNFHHSAPVGSEIDGAAIFANSLLAVRFSCSGFSFIFSIMSYG